MATSFLHFLNRELLRSVGLQPPADYFDAELRLICIGTRNLLYTNYANVFEGNYLASDLFRELIQSREIHFYGERETVEDYWYSSEKRYQFDKGRYPYMSEVQDGGIKIYPSIVRSFSMTTQLRVRLFDLLQSHKEPLGLLNHFESERLFWEIVGALTRHSGNEAITMTLASNLISESIQSKDKNVLEHYIGRYLAYLYFVEIIEALKADIYTGIKGLNIFDQASKVFPETDVPLIAKILQLCGIESRSHKIQEIIAFRKSEIHLSTSKQINAILKTLFHLHKTAGNYGLVRSKIIDVFNNTPSSHNTKKSQLDYLPIRLQQLVAILNSRQKDFSNLYIQNENMGNCILILTATNKESIAVINEAKFFFGHEMDSYPTSNHIVNFLGLKNSFKIYHAQCEMGSGGPSGSQAIATDLIDALNPNCVLMPGIAFGLQKDDQSMGDLLISTHVQSYEKQRVGDELISRNERVPASGILLSLLRTVSYSWQESATHFGTIMSGEKLVDNLDFILQLKKINPEAIGGEMEGAGLYSAAHRRKVDWIIVKSIVDWGIGKTDDHHETSSVSASKFLFQALPILIKQSDVL